MSIEVRHIAKRFGGFIALEDMSIQFPTGQLTALLGPSGCGKTTLLRIIAGLEQPDAGEVLIDQQNVSDVHVRDRHVGFVFQQYALFRHMTIFENVAFGLRVKVKSGQARFTEQDIKDKVRALLALVQLEPFADRFPSQLSGGQKQRIALARALAIEPKVLLLDEPFGALDAKVRKELRTWLRHLHQTLNVTSVFVTHDQEEALEVADQIVVMHQGHVEQIGSPDAVYNTPATPFVYDFLGSVNALKGRLSQGKFISGRAVFNAADLENKEDANGVAYIRPQDLMLQAEAAHPGLDAIPVYVTRYHAIGPVVQVDVKRQDTGDILEVAVPHDTFDQLHVAENRPYLLQAKKIRIFAENS